MFAYVNGIVNNDKRAIDTMLVANAVNPQTLSTRFRDFPKVSKLLDFFIIADVHFFLTMYNFSHQVDFEKL